MATLDRNGIEPRREQPAPDSIRVPLSRSIEQDYQSRHVFPTLRRSDKARVMGQTEIHWSSPDLVKSILSDAALRRLVVKGPLLAAYGRLVAAVEDDMKQAPDRLKWLTGVEPRLYRDAGAYKEYYALPSQFAALEVPPALALPGNPDGPAKRASYQDSRGRTCTITRAFHEFPNAYGVRVYLTKEEDLARRQANSDAATRRKAGPSFETAAAYREHAATCLAAFANIGMPEYQPGSPFNFEPSVLNAVAQKLKEAEYLLRSAQVVCTAPMVNPTGASPARVKPSLRLVHSSAEGRA